MKQSRRVNRGFGPVRVRALLTITLALLPGAAIAWWLDPQAGALASLLLVLGLLVRHLLHLHRLLHWLGDPEQALPAASGAWDEVFSLLYRRQREARAFSIAETGALLVAAVPGCERAGAFLEAVAGNPHKAFHEHARTAAHDRAGYFPLTIILHRFRTHAQRAGRMTETHSLFRATGRIADQRTRNRRSRTDRHSSGSNHGMMQLTH